MESAEQPQAGTPACRGAVGACAGSPSPLSASPHGRFGQLGTTMAEGLFAQTGLPAGARRRAVQNAIKLLPSCSILLRYRARGLPSSSFGHILPSQGHIYLAAIQSEEISHCREDWRFFHLHFKIRVLTQIPSAGKPPQGCPRPQLVGKAEPRARWRWAAQGHSMVSCSHPKPGDAGSRKRRCLSMSDLEVRLAPGTCTVPCKTPAAQMHPSPHPPPGKGRTRTSSAAHHPWRHRHSPPSPAQTADQGPR